MGGRELANRMGLLLAGALMLGALAALAWANLVDLPSWVIEPDGRATIGELGMSRVASSDWWFAVLGMAGGLVLGVAAWWTLRAVGWPVALVCVGISLAAGITCWLLGEALGPGPFAPRVATAGAGESVPVALELHALSALAVWPFAACAVPLFAASLGPDTEAAPAERPRPVDRVDA